MWQIRQNGWKSVVHAIQIGSIIILRACFNNNNSSINSENNIGYMTTAMHMPIIPNE